MTFDGNQTMQVQVVTDVNGELCYNVLEYAHESEGEWTSPDVFAAAWVAAIATEWADCLSNEATLLSLIVRSTTPTGVPPYPTAEYGINLEGANAVDADPSWVAIRITKTPNNALIEGNDPTPFRIGYLRLAGIGNTWSDGNRVTAAVAATPLNALAAALNVVIQTASVQSTTLDWEPMMFRRTYNPVTHALESYALAPIMAWSWSVRLGSQTSRKPTL